MPSRNVLREVSGKIDVFHLLAPKVAQTRNEPRPGIVARRSDTSAQSGSRTPLNSAHAASSPSCTSTSPAGRMISNTCMWRM